MTIEKSKTEDTIIYELTISKTQLLNKIKDRIEKYSWTSFLSADNIDYKEFEFDGDRIKINRKPTSLTTFGQIDLIIEEKVNGKTEMKFKVIPFDKLYPWGQFLLIAFAVMFSAFGLFLNSSIKMVLILLLGWAMIGLFIYFRLKFERYMMRRYTGLIVKDLS
jgi:hypothetical protein